MTHPKHKTVRPAQPAPAEPSEAYPDIPGVLDVPKEITPSRTIRLTRVYQGRRTNEQPIFPGDYAEDDERLFGLAAYLLTNGHAEVVEG